MLFFCLTLSTYNEIFIEMKPNKRFLTSHVGKDLSLCINSEIKIKSSALFHNHLGYTSYTMAKWSWPLGLLSLINSTFNFTCLSERRGPTWNIQIGVTRNSMLLLGKHCNREKEASSFCPTVCVCFRWFQQRVQIWYKVIVRFMNFYMP